MSRDNRDSIATLYLKEAFLYSMRDDLSATGRMLRSLMACLHLAEVNGKMGKERTLALKQELKKIETKPSKLFQQSIYELCSIYDSEPDEIEIINNGSIVGVCAPGRLTSDLRNAMDDLTEIAGEISETLGVSSIIKRRLEGVGLGD